MDLFYLYFKPLTSHIILNNNIILLKPKILVGFLLSHQHVNEIHTIIYFFLLLDDQDTLYTCVKLSNKRYRIEMDW